MKDSLSGTALARGEADVQEEKVATAGFRRRSEDGAPLFEASPTTITPIIFLVVVFGPIVAHLCVAHFDGLSPG